jgi:TatA/E family protein of Tat protein translocase
MSAHLALFGPIGPWELILILLVVLLLFGPKRLPDLAKSLGQSVRELRKAQEGKDEEEEKKASKADSESSKDEG